MIRSHASTRILALASLSGCLLLSACGNGGASNAKLTALAGAGTSSSAPSEPPMPQTYRDDRLAGLEDSIVDGRLTRPIQLRGDVSISPAMGTPQLSADKILDAVHQGDGFVPTGKNLSPVVFFCRLTADYGATILDDGSLKLRYEGAAVWAVAYHQVATHARAGSHPFGAQSEGDPIVDENVVSFVDDSTGEYIFSTEDSLVGIVQGTTPADPAKAGG